MRSRKVLIVTAAFPPHSTVGAIRPFKFARYLPEFDWDPQVLTIAGADGEGSTDTALLEQLPCEACLVHRTPAVVPSRRWVAHVAASSSAGYVSFIKRLLRAIRTALLFPDDFIGWLPFALARGLRVLRRGRIDLVFSTSPPATAHVVAMVLSRWARCPLVVDFRDPWTQHALHHWLRNPLRRRAEEALEHAVLQRASFIVGVTPPRTAELAEKYPDIPRSRFVTITNGFDTADYGPPAHAPANDRFTVVYTGSFLYYRQPDEFLKAVESVLEQRHDLRTRIRFIFAGDTGPVLTEHVTARGLGDVVTVLGVVPYHESVALQKQADLLLLFVGAGPMASTWYPAKVFEYIATGRPILALTPEGVAADLVAEAGTGIVVSPGDSAAIGQALVDLYRRWEQGSLPALVDPAFPERFERRTLTAQLAGLFWRAVESKASLG